ncbi:MAG: hypothetical protein JO236_12005 [Mycobacterium sp.]|uniref:hypothetical protein n=1 Tax=Mycobacterium sp. TaxID=1785 RepID=UPI001EC351B5|nr:hypothetical protein [Mycobacterium sp.]MBW0018252.1 hypothetical protein [Mycobacterium sp.]
MASGALLASIALTASCSSVVDGKPIAGPGAGPTEPSFPTPRPSAPSTAPTTSPTSPTSVPPTTPASPTAPAGAIPLKPDDNGYVFIETKSGKTRCQISKESVGCEAPFTNSPMEDGEHTNGVHITAAGSVQWILGNLGAIPTVTIDYKTYDAQGWTINATTDGTRFTNNKTGHGMFVSIDKVNTF